MRLGRIHKLLAAAAVALLVVGVGVWGVASARKTPSPPADSLLLLSGSGAGTQLQLGGGEGGRTADQVTTTTVVIYVQVSGAVRHPGVYQLARGARVFEALDAAGGAAADADTEAINLAAVVSDGARIVVPRVGEAPAAGPGVVGDSGSGGGGQGGAAAPISLSTADAAALDSLPGIGPATAAAIIAYREEHGPFQSVDELENVSGIGPATMARVRDLVVP